MLYIKLFLVSTKTINLAKLSWKEWLYDFFPSTNVIPQNVKSKDEISENDLLSTLNPGIFNNISYKLFSDKKLAEEYEYSKLARISIDNNYNDIEDKPFKRSPIFTILFKVQPHLNSDKKEFLFTLKPVKILNIQLGNYEFDNIIKNDLSNNPDIKPFNICDKNLFCDLNLYNEELEDLSSKQEFDSDAIKERDEKITELKDESEEANKNLTDKISDIRSLSMLYDCHMLYKYKNYATKQKSELNIEIHDKDKNNRFNLGNLEKDCLDYKIRKYIIGE